MKTFVMRDPIAPGFARRIEAEDEEEAIYIVASENTNEDGEPDWDFAESFVYEEE